MVPGDPRATILIVDDEADLREVLELSLDAVGIRALSADSGVRALEILETTPVDAVVSDMRMPDGDGVFLLEAVKKRYPNIPVILMTGFADRTRAELIGLGADDVLFKPFAIAEFRRAVDGFAKHA